MKIVLSRKGFDSTFGGCPSPIFPDKTMISMPIPETLTYEKAGIRYSNLKCSRTGFPDLGAIVQQLTGNRITGNCHAHLDPHLDPSLYGVTTDWKALFGQDTSSQGLLRNQHVGEGDLFLFYGLYQDVEVSGDHVYFQPNAPKRHVIFGWMCVGEVNRIEESERCEELRKRYPWAKYHSHLHGGKVKNNTLYVAAENCFELPFGAGIFPKYSSIQCLTAAGQSCSVWSLPEWFDPHRCEKPLSYNNNRDKWTTVHGGFQLRTKSPGQEYVFDTQFYPEATAWAKNLISACG